MRANVEYSSRDVNRKVTGAAPCPVCGGLAQCRTHLEDEFECCVAEHSEWRLDNGGWLHRVELAPAALSARLARIAGEERLSEPLSDTSSGVVS